LAGVSLDGEDRYVGLHLGRSDERVPRCCEVWAMAPTEPHPQLEPAAAAIVERLAVRPVVALGEVHWLRQGMDLILALAADPAFRGVADGIVVEFGATVHQELIDRYIAGEPVTDPIEPVWRDAMGGWGSGVWESPIYRTFYDQMRVLNQSMPDRPLRVWLGDALKAGPATAAWPDRDAHLADVVERVAFAEHRRVLLVAGGGHLTRIGDLAPPKRTAVQWLEARHPGAVEVVLPLVVWDDVRHRRPDDAAALDSLTARWPAPVVAQIADSWLASLDGRLLLGDVAMALTPGGGRVAVPLRFYDKVGSEVRDLPLHALADAIVYFGPGQSLVYVRPDERRAPR
jgi:hypothetical protein